MEQSSCHLKDYASSKPPHQIEDSSDCADDDVIISIASVLVNLVEETPFAFATAALYKRVRYDAEHGMTWVSCAGGFIIPIIFSEELRQLDPEGFDSVESQGPVKERRLTDYFSNYAKKATNNPCGTTAQKTRSQSGPKAAKDAGKQSWIGGVGHFMLVVATRLSNSGVHLI